MRDWKNTPTKDLIRKVLIHGYLMANQNMPLEFEDKDEYYDSLLAEIQKRIEKGGDDKK